MSFVRFGLKIKKTGPTQLKQTVESKPSSGSIFSTLPKKNYAKKLAIFLVIALVVAVTNFPTVQLFTCVNGSWKRVLEVIRTVFLVSIFFTNTLTDHQVKIL